MPKPTARRRVEQPHAGPATEPTPGMPATSTGMPGTAQILFAVVEADGTLTRGFGAVSASRLGVGQYQVVFGHDVTRSAYVATVGLTGGLYVAPPGGTAVVGRTGIPDGVFVETFDGAGAPADRAFHLIVAS
jgi:hypothetical protein